jgi:hypothetical protein
MMYVNLIETASGMSEAQAAIVPPRGTVTLLAQRIVTRQRRLGVLGHQGLRKSAVYLCRFCRLSLSDTLRLDPQGGSCPNCIQHGVLSCQPQAGERNFVVNGHDRIRRKFFYNKTLRFCLNGRGD